MVGGNNNGKSTTQKPPLTSSAPPAASSSSSHDRKSRWTSSNNDGGTNNNNKTTTGGQKTNPSPKLAPMPNHHHPNPTSSRPPSQFPFQDSSSSSSAAAAAALGAPPAPTYGFHMLERRTIVLVDGSVRSYFALPPNYHDFPPPPPQRRLPGRFPPFHPEEFRNLWDRPEGSTKRKHPGEEEIDRRGGDERGEMLRQRHQFMQFVNPNDQSVMVGMSSPYGRDVGEDGRPVKLMRLGTSRNESGGHHGVNKLLQVDHVALKKSFLEFVKRIFEDPSEKKNYLENGRKGRLQCLVCGRCPKDVQDTHGLVMHAYFFDDPSSRARHLGLHKALCVLMGWNFSKPPDNSKAYQNLPAEVAAINKDQLIMWPPHIIVHNTSTGKGKDGRMEGLGSKRMDDRIRELKFDVGKSRALYGRDGHLGITLFKFAGDDSGLREALRMAEYFEKTNRGRKSWAALQPFTPSKDDEKNPSLVEVDARTNEKRRILYGYLATIRDFDKVDMETKKKTTIECLSELTGSK